MPHRRKGGKNVNQKSDIRVIEATVKSMVQGHLSVRSESELYEFAVSTIHGRASDTEETATGLNPCVRDRIVHQTEISSEREKILFERIKYSRTLL
jgi:hypothetical protein